MHAAVLHACMQGEPWPCAIRGHELDTLTQQADQQRLMLERFQAEVRDACMHARVHASAVHKCCTRRPAPACKACRAPLR